MPIRDATARRKSLRNDYGTNAAADAPSSHDLHLFNGDPMLDGVEVTGDGYAAVQVDPADWVDDESEAIVALVTMPAPTGAWDIATHWALEGSDGLWWDCGEFATPLNVTGAGDGPLVRVPIFYADAITEED